MIDLVPRIASVADPRIRWLPMTQQEIGDDLGLTVVQVNRVLRRRFREAGMATLRGGTAVTHNPAALQRSAEPLQDIVERAAPEFGGSPGSSANL